MNRSSANRRSTNGNSYRLSGHFTPPYTGPKQTIDSTGEPTAADFIFMCILSVFKKFVFAPTHIKIGLYMLTLVVCSLMRDFNIVNERFFFANKGNFLNVYFVKLGWFWTLLVSTPFVIMTSIVYTGFNKAIIRNSLIRLVIATLSWFIFTSAFEYIDAITGKCTLPKLRTKNACRSGNHEWIYGFDISGHTFILMHSLFLMLEEVKIYTQWEEMKKKLNDLAKKNEFTPSTERMNYWFNLLTPYIRLNFFMMASLALLWEIMLLCTFMYFHTIMHKLVAAFFAIIIWFVTYKSWYSLDLSPGLPGVGMVTLWAC